MSTVGLIPRLAKEEAAILAREMVRWLEARGHRALVEEEAGVEGVPTALGCDLATSADLLVVLGGDGTLIHAASLCREREVPILGVNLGTLGFLTEVPRERAFPLLEKALAGELTASRRLMLAVEVRRAEALLLSGVVLNDAVISKNALSRLATLEVSVDGRPATTYEADGLIVATPTGSTAYSLSAGGPVLAPDSGVFVVTPICPHVLTMRSMMVSDHSLIEITHNHATTDIFLTLDGQNSVRIGPGDSIRIRKAAHHLALAMLPGMSFFEVLRQKLKWSGTAV